MWLVWKRSHLYSSFESTAGQNYDRVVCHILPILSVVSTHGEHGKKKFFLSLFYLFFYRTIEAPSYWNANLIDKYRAIVLFPIFWSFRSGSSSASTLCGTFKSTVAKFMATLNIRNLAGLAWFFRGSSSWTALILPFFYLHKRQSEVRFRLCAT